MIRSRCRSRSELGRAQPHWLAIFTSLATFIAFLTVSATPANAVYEGQEATFIRGQVQFAVAGAYRCAGVAIDQQWVLTAKHCVVPNSSPGAPATPNNTELRFNSVHRGQGLLRNVQQFVLNQTLDAALMKLAQPVPRSLAVPLGTGALGDPSGPDPSPTVTASGWGETELNPGLPSAVMKTAVMTPTLEGNIDLSDVRLIEKYPLSGTSTMGDSGTAVMYHGSVCGMLRRGNSLAPRYADAIRLTALRQWIDAPAGMTQSRGADCSGRDNNMKSTYLRVMALGDQIASGARSSGGNGYRANLKGLLRQLGAQGVDLVGSQHSGGMSDNDNEGYSGYTIDQLLPVAQKAVSAYRPNVVLLNVGTNDMRQGLGDAQHRLENLLHAVYAANPGVTVVLPTLIRSTDAATESRIEQFNASVPGIVDTFQGVGNHMVLATMDSVETTDLADDVTPSDSGYAKIADIFADGVEQAVQSGLVATRPGAAGSRPCDIYQFSGTPCAAAHSTVRALYSDYQGPLYQVQRASDNTATDIGLTIVGGLADAARQDRFCAGTSCVITKIYDQSPYHNDLTVEGAGSAAGADHAADASALPITIGGTKVYGLAVTGHVGYRDNATRGIATGGGPEGMYMVASGTHVNNGCCFDYGNAETNTTDNGNGHMDTVNLGTTCYFAPCTGAGPWVQADMENGLFQGANGSNLANKGNDSNFVTAMLKNDGQTTYALKGGDAQHGDLSTWWEGPLPDRGGYRPMQQEGAIVLGTGGDNSNASIGSFFEGVMTQGYPSDAADDQVQAGIVSAAYGGSSNPTGFSDGSAVASGQAVVHDEYTSVYTVNALNNHLQETYLPAVGQAWVTQDLSAEYDVPSVAAGTEPVAVVHTPNTSVFTVDADDGHLQETYLNVLGQPWKTQDLTANYHTPITSATPTVVVHDGYTSVYTINASNGHLQETYLSALGKPWVTQDLSDNYHTPAVEAGTGAVAVYHSTYTSVYTVDANHDLQETYLSKIGEPWVTQDLRAIAGTPPTTATPTAAVHDGYTSVYTVDDANNHLQETYLSGIGAPWVSQDFSEKYQTPNVAPGTRPVSAVHGGYTSVYTVDQASDHLQETYLTAIGQRWISQDLSAQFHTPPSTRTPIALTHPGPQGSTYTSLYTVNQFNNHLQETYLSAIGDPWITQDLSVNYHTPPVRVADVPRPGSAVVHDGYTSVYSINKGTGDLEETYLPGMGQAWVAQDLSAKYKVPPSQTAAVALTHQENTSVFTVDKSNGHLRETYLTAIGQPWKTQDLSASYGTPVTHVTPTAINHEYYTSVFTVDASNNHLQETYLSTLGQPWETQDLTAEYGAPTVAANTAPTAAYHSGYTSVYTVDASNNHLQETYLLAIGDAWNSQDLTARYGAAPTSTTPAALVHDGYTSVFTVDASNGHLRETFVPAIGDNWTTQDLTVEYHTPAVLKGDIPRPLYHTGYTSVYTVNSTDSHLQETYLPAIGAVWTSQDLSDKYKTPATVETPTPLLHYDSDGGLTYASVYSVDNGSSHLQETYLPAINQSWITQDLSDKYHTPPVS